MPQCVALVAFIVNAAACAHVQPVRSWPALIPHVAPGQPVTVVDAAGGEARGSLAAISAESITLDVGGVVRQFNASSVREVARNGDPLWNGLAMGAAIGTAAALLPDNVCSGAPSTCEGSQIPGRVAIAAIGAALGVAADALHRDRSVLYAAPGRMSLHVVPVLTGRRTGVMVVLTRGLPSAR
jgi:hypothetical protein